MATPICHTLVGGIILLALERNPQWFKRPLNVLSLIILSNIYDLDFLVDQFIKPKKYFHHSYTHSILAVILLWGILILLKKITPFSYKRDNILKLSNFTLICLLASHLLVDLFTRDTSFPYGAMYLYPFSEKYYYLPLYFFMDVSKGGFKELFSIGNFRSIAIELFFFSPGFFYLYRGFKKNEA